MRLGDVLQSQSLTSLIKWLKEYNECASEITGDVYGKRVCTALKTAGYQANAYVGLKFVEGNKSILGKYLIGQVITSLEDGDLRYGVVERFCNDYLAMKD